MYKVAAKIAAFIYCAAIIVISVVFTIMDANNNLVKEVSIEAGDRISIEDFFNDCPADAKFLTDISTIDTKVPAVYQLAVQYGEMFENTVTLKIEDHTGPRGVALPKEMYARTKWPKASDCVGFLYDLSGVAKVEYQHGTPDIEIAGDYMVPVEVTDWYDNKTIINVPFHITDDHNAPVFYGIHDFYVDNSKDVVIDYFEGISVKDDYDVDPKMDIDDSKVQIGKVGTYEIVYKTADSAGNMRKQVAHVFISKVKVSNSRLGAGGLWDSRRHNEIYSMARKLVKRLKGRNDTETARNIVNYVHDNVFYMNVRGQQSFEAAVYRALTQRSGDCFGYFCTTKLLLDVAGIPNMMVRRYPMKWSGHYWNLVKLGGKWYHCDSTLYRYHWAPFFKMTDSKIGDSHHHFRGSILPTRAGGTPEYKKEQAKENKK